MRSDSLNPVGVSVNNRDQRKLPLPTRTRVRPLPPEALSTAPAGIPVILIDNVSPASGWMSADVIERGILVFAIPVAVLTCKLGAEAIKGDAAGSPNSVAVKLAMVWLTKVRVRPLPI